MAAHAAKEKCVALWQVLEDEAVAQHGELPPEYSQRRERLLEYARRRSGSSGSPPDDALQERWQNRLILPWLYRYIHARCPRRAALCFSGGGIRSATFNLGVLQRLAGHGLLKQFDFIS